MPSDVLGGTRGGSSNSGGMQSFWNQYGGMVGKGISTASGIASGLFGRKWKQKQMQNQRDHEIAMYERNLADSRYNWQMENQYNSPEMVMQRLKDAGLNPNLVYGNGADAQGGQINTPSPQVSNQGGVEPPDYNRKSMMIDQIYDLR